MDASDLLDVEPSLMRLGAALALGLLVGLQRERAASRVAGVRTVTLVTLFGALAGLGAPVYGAWLLAAGAVALAALLVMANVAKLREAPDPGMTTEVAVLLMYALGAYLAVGHVAVAVVVAGAAVLLLHFKRPLHRRIEALGDQDMTAIMQFALVTLVILPVLPDRTYGPYAVLNPRQVWWMVVLIVGINLAGYVAMKLAGQRGGTLLAGLLGGLVSSTATTVAYARRSAAAGDGGLARLAALVIVLASPVSVARVLVEVAVVAPSRWASIAPPLAALLGWMAVLSALAWVLGRRAEAAAQFPERENPAELKSALVFAAIYAAITFGVAVAKERLGDSGLYAVAVLSGLTDVDAITLSTANLAQAGRLEAQTAARVMLIAALANLAFKAGFAIVLGGAALRRLVAVWFALAIAGGVAILLLWPRP